MAVRFWELYEETREQYQLRILAGKKGMDSVISWVHMLEDETIVGRFRGTELAVTTGIKASERGWMLRLVEAMHEAECAGLIVNTGMYLQRVPADVVDWCELHDFPLLELPWEITLAELVQDYCMRIMQQSRKQHQEGVMLERLLRGQDTPDSFLEDLGSRFDCQGSFHVFCMYPKYSAEEKVLFRQALLKLENVFGLWKRGHKIRFPYFLVDARECYALAVNDLPEEAVPGLIEQIRALFSYFFEKGQLALGIGPSCRGIPNLNRAFERARIAMKMARDMHRGIVFFDEMGVFGLLFSSEEPEILRDFADRMLGPVEAHDRNKGAQDTAGYTALLRSYIENDRSLLAVSHALYLHRNTVNYRIQNIKQLLGSELKTSADLLPYQLAFCIRDMGL